MYDEVSISIPGWSETCHTLINPPECQDYMQAQPKVVSYQTSSHVKATEKPFKERREGCEDRVVSKVPEAKA